MQQKKMKKTASNASNKKTILRIIAGIILAVVLIAAFIRENRQAIPEKSTAAEEFSSTAESTREENTAKKTAGPTQTEESETGTQEQSSETSLMSSESESTQAPEKSTKADNGISVDKKGEYSDKEHVAAYIHKYGKLPSNYITKDKAETLGWDSEKGNLWKVAYGKSIGGDYFGNYEGALPAKKGRAYHECDIDYAGGKRNAKRIVYSTDGLIYYTDDHYKTFTLLYGEE